MGRVNENIRYFLIEITKEGVRKYIRKWDGTAMAFKDPMTATVMADGLRHAGRVIDVVEIDLTHEEPIL